MEVTLLYFDDCPNWKVANGHLRQLADEIEDLTVRHQLVTTPDQAERYKFRGSPSFSIDGADPFATDEDPIGMSCRMYVTPAGLAGSPTLNQLREALSNPQR